MSDGATIKALPIPAHHRHVGDALGSAANLERAGRLTNIVIISEDEEGLLFLSAGAGEQLTGAQALWLLERAKNLLMSPDSFVKVG